MNTQELIIKARSGDRQALRQLLWEHKGLVAAVVNRYAWQRESLADTVQSIFVRAIHGLQTFKGSCRFTTWLYRVALNECIDRNRALQRERRHRHLPADAVIEQYADPGGADGLELLSDGEIAEAIRGMVNRLPLDQRTAFSLFYFGNYRGGEAARAMQISEANFFMKLKAARDAVKNELRRQGWDV